MYLGSIVSALALSTCALAKVFTVKVGPGDDLVFEPSTIKAEVGDQITFEFESEGHSVAQGDFDNACQPDDDSDAWYSGFVDPGKVWTITVDDDEPYAFYCSAPSHCQAGMVGVINPADDDTLAAYKAAAGMSSTSKSPPKVQGGVFKAASSLSASASASVSAAASSSSTMNAAPTAMVNGIAGMIPLGVAAYMGL